MLCSSEGLWNPLRMTRVYSRWFGEVVREPQLEGHDERDARSCNRVSPVAYAVTRLVRNERAFSGRYPDWKPLGTSVPDRCGTPLFASKAKPELRAGWPSYAVRSAFGIDTKPSNARYEMGRAEAIHSACKAPLGQVFPDGSLPKGLRHCLNFPALVVRRLDGSPSDQPNCIRSLVLHEC